MEIRSLYTQLCNLSSAVELPEKKESFYSFRFHTRIVYRPKNQHFLY